MIEKWFSIILIISIKASILAFILLVIKKIFANSFRAKWHYAIWILLIIKLVLISAPVSNFSIYKYTDNTISKIEIIVSEDIKADLSESTFQSKEVDNRAYDKPIVKKSFKPIAILGYLWFSVLIVLLICYLILKSKLLFLHKRVIKCCDGEYIDLLKECKEEINCKRKIEILFDNYIKAPATFGVICPKIVLPYETRFDKMQLKYIILHELVHIKRCDSLFKDLGVILCITHWFNPLLWYCLVVFDRDAEFSCDEYLIEKLEERHHSTYCKVIVDIVERTIKPKRYMNVSCMALEKTQVKKRITRIVGYTKKSKKNMLLSISIIIILLFATIPNSSAQEEISIDLPNPITKEDIHIDLPQLTEKKEVNTGTILDKYFGKYQYELMSELGEPNNIIEPHQGEGIDNVTRLLEYTIEDHQVQFGFAAYEEDTLWEIRVPNYLGLNIGIGKDEALEILEENYSMNQYYVDGDRLQFNFEKYYLNLIFDKENKLNHIILARN